MLSVDGNGTIKLTRGDTARLNVSVKNSLTGKPYTIAEGDTLTLTVREKATSTSIKLQKTLTGAKCFDIAPEDTSKLQFMTYTYDIQLTQKNGDVYTIVGPAPFVILPEVTY